MLLMKTCLCLTTVLVAVVVLSEAKLYNLHIDKAVAWTETDKLGSLLSIIKAVSNEDTNVTLIGWQHDGIQYKGVELIIPTTSSNSTRKVESDQAKLRESAMVPYDKVEELKDQLAPLESLGGVEISGAIELYSENNEPEVLIFVDRNTLYTKAEDFEIVNKTLAVATLEEIDAFVQKLPTSDVSVLHYDQKGNLMNNSKVFPRLLGCLHDNYEATDEIFLESPKIMAEIVVEFPENEVPKELGRVFNKKWPEFDWRVLKNPNGRYLLRDISVTLTTDQFKLDGTKTEEHYLVYGRKVEPSSTL